MPQPHHYQATLRWTGADRGPAMSYEAYSREFVVEIAGKPPLVGSADPQFRGDPALHNPEDLLVAALSSCHMLSYLALAVRAKIPVIAYEDRAEGTMLFEGGGGRFTEVTLRPRVLVAAGSDLGRARALHAQAHAICFIARSVNFPVKHEASIDEAAIPQAGAMSR